MSMRGFELFAFLAGVERFKNRPFKVLDVSFQDA